MTDDHERLIGEYGARLGQLEDDFSRIDDRLEKQGLCLARIERTLAQARGGWKTLTGLGVLASGILSAFLGWWLRGPS